jgi:hypothetical protein
MSFNGYLIKVGNYKFPLKYILAESYVVKKNIQDFESYRDANGILHRNALDHYAITVSFEIKQNRTNLEINEIMSNIKANFTIPKERRADVTLYVPEEDAYITQAMYMPDIEFTIKEISDIIKYDKIKFEFIGY